MRRYYSRLSKTEEKRNIRRAVVYSILTLTVFALLIGFGIPSFAKLAGFLAELRKSTSPIEKGDITPPAPPLVDDLPDFTNQKNLTLTGSAEPGIKVIILFNNQNSEILSDNDGRFSSNLSLVKGENTLSLQAKDNAVNLSQETKEYQIVFDDTPPKLEIKSPADQSNFFGSKQKEVNIEGLAEEEVGLTINDRFVSVDENGNFVFKTILEEGENKFLIKALDKAGNSIETSLTLHFSL